MLISYKTIYKKGPDDQITNLNTFKRLKTYLGGLLFLCTLNINKLFI